MTSDRKEKRKSNASCNSKASSSIANIDEVLQEVGVLLKRFLCNDFESAISGVNHRAEDHPYFHLLRAYFNTTKALITFEEDNLEYALRTCHEALAFADAHRRSRGLLKIVWSPAYDEYTETEAHAEICYATISAFIAVLTLMVEKSLIGLFKAGYRLKSSHDSLRESSAICDQRTNWESDLSQETFMNGIQILRGVFTLMTSHLPTRVLKLVQFLGFDGSRKYALSELEQALNTNQTWSPMAALLLLIYNTQVEYVIGLGEGNMILVASILDVYLVTYKDVSRLKLYDYRTIP